MENNDLILTDEEKSKIASSLDEYKFSIVKNSYLYSEDSLTSLRNFSNSYRFILYVITTLKDDIKSKFENYLFQYEEIYFKSEEYLNEHKLSTSELKKKRLQKKITKLIIINKEKINKIFSDIYPLLKKMDLYDVDENIGLRN